MENKEIAEPKQINPQKDKGNYIIQIVADGKVIKEVIAIGATVNIVDIGNNSLAAVTK